MSKLITTLIIGIIAGIIDIIPMIIQKLDKYANISAFVFWIVTSFVISYIKLPLNPVIKGLVVAELSAVPIMIIISKDGIKAILPVIIMTAVLGSLVGFSLGKFIK